MAPEPVLYAGATGQEAVRTALRPRLANFALDRLPPKLAWRIAFARSNGYWPRLRSPRTFNEKVLWRILCDRRPILIELEGKLSAKDFVAARAPEVRIPETFWSGTDVSQLADVDLPDRWVLKPNNSTHLVHFGRGSLSPRTAASLAAAIGRADWLGGGPFTPGVSWSRKWAHREAERVYLVEEFIGTDAAPPRDIKLFAFDGRVALIVVLEGRFGNERYRYFDREWTPLAVVQKGEAPGDISAPPQAVCAELMSVAERIARGVDSLRVDLYEVGGEIWFGELTCYSGSSLVRLSPRSFDFELGARWQLPAATGR